MLTILFDGVAYGMVLFVLACGLAVTLGLMNFVNLAHGAFAMAGGYVTATLMNRYGVPFSPPSLAFSTGPCRACAWNEHFTGISMAALISIRFCFRLDSSSWLWRPSITRWARSNNHPASELASGTSRHSRRTGWPLPQLHHRVCGILVVTLQLILTRTRFGSRFGLGRRSSVASGLGINVGAIFATTFAVGSGLAGLGGALGAESLVSTRLFRSSS